MILALVDNDRHRRQELRMIIRPLSDEFIDSSPEAVSPYYYRLEPSHPPSGILAIEFSDDKG